MENEQKEKNFGLVTNCQSHDICKSVGVVSCIVCPDFRPKNIEVQK
jgi:hypothetical protein